MTLEQKTKKTSIEKSYGCSRVCMRSIQFGNANREDISLTHQRKRIMATKQHVSHHCFRNLYRWVPLSTCKTPKIAEKEAFFTKVIHQEENDFM